MISNETKIKGTIRIGLHLLDLKIEPTDVLQQEMISGKLDMIISNEINQELDCINLGNFPLKWFYAPEHASIVKNRLSPLPLVVLGPNCKMRQIALFSLNNAEITWRIAFSSSNLSNVGCSKCRHRNQCQNGDWSACPASTCSALLWFTKIASHSCLPLYCKR